MSLEFLGTALLAISIVTSLTVEGIKKIFEACKKNCPSNLVAIIVSVLITVIASVVYVILKNIPFSFLLVVEIVVLVFLSFLVSTLGYDKVMQLLKQFTQHKDNESTDKKDEENGGE